MLETLETISLLTDKLIEVHALKVNETKTRTALSVWSLPAERFSSVMSRLKNILEKQLCGVARG